MKRDPLILTGQLVVLAIVVFALGFVVFTIQPFERPNPYGTEYLVRSAGYPFEKHTLTTKDGYILGIHRIPHGRMMDDKSYRPPVLLQHGLSLDSSVFVSMEHQSLAFMLADAGFDVWLGNNRGNSYCRNHVNYSHWQPSFWDFTWEEMALYDIPAVVDKILEVTGEQKLHYIAHSQGALTMMALLSTDESYNDKVKEIYGLAPALSVVNIKGPVKLIAPLAPLLQKIQMVLGPFGIFRRSWTNDLLSSFCTLPIIGPHCLKHMYATGGPYSEQIDSNRAKVFLSAYPDGTSSKNIIHFGQMVSQQRTARFDYGEKENMRRYGESIAPSFDFSKVRVPMHYWYSQRDYLTNDWDFHEIVFPALDQQFLKSNTCLSDYNHFDFHWGSRAAVEIYMPIINKLKEGQTCDKTP